MGETAADKRSRLRLGLEVAVLVLFVVVGLVIIFPGSFSVFLGTPTKGLRPAMFYEKLEGSAVQCQLCFRKCVIEDGQRGFCTNRKNVGGALYTLVYGKLCALQIDPVEKEPLFHVLPGTPSFCIGTAGCNFRCSFCQNWRLAHMTIEEVEHSEHTPEAVVDLALEWRCTGFHFTYNEPTVFYEYMYDVAKVARGRGLLVGVHTNGAINPEPLRELLRYVDAVTVDLKGFDDEYYEYVTEQSTSGPHLPSTPPLEAVKTTMLTVREEGIWLELVNLLIPTLNDDMGEVEEMCVWIRENLGEDTPLHFIRFQPAHKLTKLPMTPVETLERARSTAIVAGLKYVYIGNVPGHEGNSLYCPECGEILILRFHFMVFENKLEDGRCSYCGYEIPGIWGE